jgi:hypothetical protein
MPHGSFIRRVAIDSLQSSMALLLVFICLVPSLAVWVIVPRDFGYGVTGTLEENAMEFKDTAYLLMADGSDSTAKFWLSHIGFPRESKLLLGVFASFLCFSCTRLFLSLVPRSKMAALSGYLAGMGISALVVHCWLRLDLIYTNDIEVMEPGVLGWILSVLLVATILIFLFSARFAVSPANRTGFLFFPGLSICVVLSTLTFFTFAYPHSIRFSRESAFSFGTPLLSGDGKNIIINEMAQGSAAPQIERVSVPSGEIIPISGRLAYSPAVSPDGKWIAYLSQRNIIGLVSNSVDLRLARMDGSQDRLLVSDVDDMPYFISETRSEPVFSPDNRHIAVVCGDKLVSCDIVSKHPVRIALPSSLGCAYLAAGWDRSSSEILVGPQYGYGGPVLAYNMATGQFRTIIDNRSFDPKLAFLKISAEVTHVLHDDIVLDMASGAKQSIADSKCRVSGISASKTFLVYANSEKGNYRPSWTEIHWRDLSSGHEDVVAAFHGLLTEPFLVSPEGDWVLARDHTQPDYPHAILVKRTGAIKHFSKDWMPLGWINKSKIAFWKDEKSTPLAVGDVETMKIQTIHR